MFHHHVNGGSHLVGGCTVDAHTPTSPSSPADIGTGSGLGPGFGLKAPSSSVIGGSAGNGVSIEGGVGLGAGLILPPGGVAGDREPLYVPPRSTGSEVTRVPSPVTPPVPPNHPHPHISPSPSPTSIQPSIQPSIHPHSEGRPTIRTPSSSTSQCTWSHANADNDPRRGGLTHTLSPPLSPPSHIYHRPPAHTSLKHPCTSFIYLLIFLLPPTTQPIVPLCPASGLTYSPLVTTVALVSHLRPALRRALPTTLLACATAMHGLALGQGLAQGQGLAATSGVDSSYRGSRAYDADAEIRMLFAVAVAVMEEEYLHHQVPLPSRYYRYTVTYLPLSPHT